MTSISATGWKRKNVADAVEAIAQELNDGSFLVQDCKRCICHKKPKKGKEYACTSPYRDLNEWTIDQPQGMTFTMVYKSHFSPYIYIDKPEGLELSEKLVFPISFPWEYTCVFIDLEKSLVVGQYRGEFVCQREFEDNMGIVKAIKRRYRPKGTKDYPLNKQPVLH